MTTDDCTPVVFVDDPDRAAPYAWYCATHRREKYGYVSQEAVRIAAQRHRDEAGSGR